MADYKLEPSRTGERRPIILCDAAVLNNTKSYMLHALSSIPSMRYKVVIWADERAS